ncbi:Elongation factor P [Candidatus Erwinia haradaeae]|uniref:Elongation factor P n=1 Tax=Candidatus Erwinia haradaeae TaxID=1922217 RepID=A0A451DCY3_9GAMM|nr:elongation factor P [Candidatus Erwinia haradaeae]VFP84321.1 Elongation factor P [Candidatus Erwinia haradaeae]
MTAYSSSDFRSGLKIIFEDEPYAIESSEFVKPGKGQAFVRVKMRRLLTGNRVDKTFKSTEVAQSAHIYDTNLNYLYHDGNFFYFMHPKSFEQYCIDKSTVGEAAKWLVSNTECIVTLWNNKPIQVLSQNFVELEIIDTDPGLKGDTTGGSGKSAILSTGAFVKVPLFLQIGEWIKIDTRSGEYISRVK